MKCESGRELSLDESVGCQKEARFLLQYSVDWKLLRAERNHPHAADMEMYSCSGHVLDIDFVFEPNHGLPERIIDIPYEKERPDLVREIGKRYEKWRARPPK